MTDPGPLPSRIAKADGRRDRFDGDQISRTVFAATKRIGRGDPLLARELADGVLHFLSAEWPAETIAATDVTDAIVKVVRELGHPLLARAIELQSASARCESEGLFATIPFGVGDLGGGSKEESSRTLSAPNIGLPAELLAAERDGLLRFLSPVAPTKFAGVVLSPPSNPEDWASVLSAASETASAFIALDGREPCFASPNSARQLRLALRGSRLRAVVNLNLAQPADDGTLDDLLEPPSPTVRVDWHLTENDLGPGGRDRLIALGRRVAAGLPLAFVVDRPPRPVSLAEGLNGDRPAILGAVGLSLPRLFNAVCGADNAVAVFLSKLSSLTRLAISTGRAWRDSLRGAAVLSSGFLVDRAQLLVTPLGEEAVAAMLAGRATADFVHNIRLALHAALTRDADRLPAVLDGLPFAGVPSGDRPATWNIEESPTLLTVPGQLRAAAKTHAAIGGGTADIAVPIEADPPPEAVVEWLEFAVRQPGLDRFRFVRRVKPYRQLTAGW
jgi:hypothetical protein